MDTLTMMAVGAATLASFGDQHTPQHASVGFSEAEWRLLRQDQPWTAPERRRIRSVLAEALTVSMTLAGLPGGPLPAEYVAAVITKVVHPVNRLLAAESAPASFDSVSASGLRSPAEVIFVERETMISLVQAYSSGIVPAVSKALYGTSEADDDVVRRLEAQ